MRIETGTFILPPFVENSEVELLIFKDVSVNRVKINQFHPEVFYGLFYGLFQMFQVCVCQLDSCVSIGQRGSPPDFGNKSLMVSNCSDNVFMASPLLCVVFKYSVHQL
jgi:hypothetical protein